MKKDKNFKTLSSEDISNLAIFKSIQAESGALRNQATKKKINELRFSNLLIPKEQKPSGSNRRALLTSLVNAEIGIQKSYNKLTEG